MNAYLTVNRAADTLSGMVKNKTEGHVTESMKQLLPSIEMMQLLFPDWTFKTCRLTHPNLDYISSNCKQLFGYSSDMVGQMGQQQLFRFIPEEDCEDMYNGLLFMQNFYHDHSPADFHKLRAVMLYRFVKPDGTIITVRDEKASLQMKDSKYLYYTMYKDVSHEVPFTGVKLAFYSKAGGQKIAEYRPAGTDAQLSSREGELLLLIRSGLSTKEMAWQMNISHHTVRNIRQRMFEKFRVSNSIELINNTRHII